MRGLVLAGGKSLRYGTDKALVVYKGISLLKRAILLLKALQLNPVVVTRPDAEHSIGCELIYDKLSEKGPLGGIYTAMAVFKDTAFLILPCDMPKLTPKMLLDLLALHKPQFGVTAYSLKSKIQPFPGIYEPSILEIIQNKLKQDNLSMHDLMDRVPTKKVIYWKGDQKIFSNINYKKDLK